MFLAKSACTLLFINSVLLLVTPGHAETAAMLQTKTKIKALETKISNLHQTLDSAHDKNEVLNKELSETEKKISLNIQQLHHSQHDMEIKEQKITELQHQVTVLDNKLHTQQHLLAKHIRARYTMGEYQPLKWLLNQDNPYTMNRLLTFYQYIVQSRQHIISHIQDISKNLSIGQEKLKQEIAEQQQLQQQITKHQQKLEQEKIYSTAILRTLDQEIKSAQQALEESERNKNNLSNLLKSLAQRSILQTQRPLIYMRNKLPRPVDVSKNNLQNMNQGVVFFANEGTSVAAVSSGKVVFSDWLKGYGLLLIIDHGHGFMTLYAHNQSLFKQKGDIVDQGDQIATVGHSGGIKQNGLYFEIRQRGKAIPPLKWLS
jgi:septal ring factor EnvC (AmiA/AmiB activator)